MARIHQCELAAAYAKVDLNCHCLIRIIARAGGSKVQDRDARIHRSSPEAQRDTSQQNRHDTAHEAAGQQTCCIILRRGRQPGKAGGQGDKQTDHDHFSRKDGEIPCMHSQQHALEEGPDWSVYGSY